MSSGEPLAEAKREKASSQDRARAQLQAATDRRVAADAEQRAAVEALHETALRVHADKLVPVKEILAITGLKESWFYQLRKRALETAQGEGE